jgi:hypothetical protein
MTDCSPGDVINFSYYWLPHEAVVMKVQYPETIKCEVVRCPPIWQVIYLSLPGL